MTGGKKNPCGASASSGSRCVCSYEEDSEGSRVVSNEVRCRRRPRYQGVLYVVYGGDERRKKTVISIEKWGRSVRLVTPRPPL